MSNNFNLINSLFNNPGTQAKTVSPAQQTGYTKRTWKISDEHWEEFVALSKVLDKTQADLINELIAKAVEENTKEISKYFELFPKKSKK